MKRWAFLQSLIIAPFSVSFIASSLENSIPKPRRSKGISHIADTKARDTSKGITNKELREISRKAFNNPSNYCIEIELSEDVKYYKVIQ